MVIDATPSGVSSNSYVTLTEANAYFAMRLNADDWSDAEESDKEKALVMATYRLEQETYDFWRSTQSQALKWPRVGVINPDGVDVPSNLIPIEVKNATYELALTMLKTDFLSSTGLSNFRSMSLAGVISLVPRWLTSGDLPDNVQRWLLGYTVGNSGTVRLVRS